MIKSISNHVQITKYLVCVKTPCLPAQISSKDVQEFFPGKEGVEDTAICPIDHVALVRRPPVHLTVSEKMNRW